MECRGDKNLCKNEINKVTEKEARIAKKNAWRKGRGFACSNPLHWTAERTRRKENKNKAKEEKEPRKDQKEKTTRGKRVR